MSYLNEKLNREHLERLAFEHNWELEYWHDIDSKVKIYELLDSSGYQQFVYGEDELVKFSFGIPLKTVEELMLRYKSITGYDARYYTGMMPINAQ